SFAAALELVREGVLAMRQEKAYAPLYLRKGPAKGAPKGGNG
ncbi:MAG TPA: segregation/condensation protein A, partial [Rhizobiaceae bacterium]|nr:segregation/condensation protein A [Rhizobiaceae bacterium]